MSAATVATAKSQGEGKSNTVVSTLKGEHTVTLIDDTPDQKFLDMMCQEQARDPSLMGREIVHITPELVEVEHEIEELQKSLDKPTENKQETPKDPTARPRPVTQAKKFSSVFEMARSLNKNSRAPTPTSTPQVTRTQEGRNERLNPLEASSSQKNSLPEEKLPTKPEKNSSDQGGEGGGGRERGHDEQKRRYSATHAVGRKSSLYGSSDAGGIDSIFIRFMALMARILGQAEADAHELYGRIKARTDDVDHLTLLISKLNSEKGKVDWSKDEEMKLLIDRAREIGVDIPEGKYKWSDTEKKLLKENIQMRKDSLEKITQLERTDMQRFLQEASQCHQARSNVLKLLKEVMDTIIHNMRP